MKRPARIGKDIKSLKNIQISPEFDLELSERFIQDVLRITGLTEDSEGYIIDTEDDPFDPEYIIIKGKKLRHTNQGVLHRDDIIFDPYNNPIIMPELFKKYVATVHPEICSVQILAYDTKVVPKLDTYGYLTILYDNGATIKTDIHYRDATKYLDAFMRLEAMTNPIIRDTLRDYDKYEKEYFIKLEHQVPKVRSLRKK